MRAGTGACPYGGGDGDGGVIVRFLQMQVEDAK